MANRALLSLAAGFGGGYLQGKQRNRNNEREDRIDAQNTELHNARMDEINAGRQQRISLADAVAPRTADTGTVVDGGQTTEFYKDPAQVTPELQQDRQIEAEMRAEQAGQPAPTLAQAKPGFGVKAGSKSQIRTDKPDLAAENSPDAKLKRQIEVIQTTDPAKAITLANAALDQKQKIQAEADKSMYRRINGFQTPQEMADFMTEYPHDGMGGKFKSKAVPSADGKTWSFIGIDKDGNEVKIPGEYTNDDDGMVRAREALASRFGDPNRRLEFYKWDQEMGRKKGAAAETARHNSVMESAATKRADAAMKAAGASGGGNLNREERIRYTTLFNDAGRRLGESKKTLATLQKSALFMTQARTEGSPQAQQMQELQDSIKGYEEERALYQGLLAGSQAPQGKGGGGAPAAPKPAADGGQPAQPTTQADYDALPKGARYMRDGKVYIKN